MLLVLLHSNKPIFTIITTTAELVGISPDMVNVQTRKIMKITKITTETFTSLAFTSVSPFPSKLLSIISTQIACVLSN